MCHNVTGTCLFDISKRFDSINHTIRLKKLEMYGINSTELKWLCRYLRGCKQVLKFHQETPEFCDITCGVPQGSVPGSIFFYPRPVLASGYCRCLRLSVSPSVRPSARHQVCPRDNSLPIQARITKFGP